MKIALIRTTQSKGVNGTYKHIPMSSLNQVDIVASFQTSYFISGIAPFGDSLVILAYIPGEEDGEKDFSSTIPSRQVTVSFSFFLDLDLDSRIKSLCTWPFSYMDQSHYLLYLMFGEMLSCAQHVCVIQILMKGGIIEKYGYATSVNL